MKKNIYKSFEDVGLNSAPAEEIGQNTNLISSFNCEKCPYLACMQIAFKHLSITGYCARFRRSVDGASPCLQHSQSLQLSIF